MFNPLKYFVNRKVGLVLGSGGAKGIAHISVIEYLEENNVPIDMIAGSSVGALVAAIYLCGNLQRLKKDMVSFNKKDLFGLVDPIIPVSSMIGPDKIINWMKKYIDENINIEELPRPFSVVATDYRTGRPVIFNSGNLLFAVLASISIPGILPSVKYHESFLVDGGVANPIPVDVVRKMGAGRIVAVNLHPRLKIYDSKKKSKNVKFENAEDLDDQIHKGTVLDKVRSLSDKFNIKVFRKVASYIENKTAPKDDDGLPNIFETILRTIDIMELNNTVLILKYNKPDLLIEPDLAHMGMVEFYRSADALQEGRNACEQNSGKLVRKIKLWV